MGYVIVHGEKRFSYSKARRRAGVVLLLIAGLLMVLKFTPMPQNQIPTPTAQPGVEKPTSNLPPGIETPPVPATPTATSSPQPSGVEAAKQAFANINALRAQNGLPAIIWDDNDYALAVWRSSDMVNRGYFDHTTPEGVLIGGIFLFENIAATGNPIRAMASWQSSPGHNANLLYPGFAYGAVGCYENICVWIGTPAPGANVDDVRRLFDLP